MKRADVATTLLALFVALACSSDHRARGDDVENHRVRAFWKALSTGDVEAAKAFYAPQVVLRRGSELLKPRWGIGKEGDRSKDLRVDRDDLAQGYARMIKAVGRDKWTELLSEIEDARIKIRTAKQADKPFGGVKLGDTVLEVATGPGDDTLFFVLRKDQSGKLLVHLEATDY